MPENAIQAALETLSGQSWEAFFADYVYGSRRPDYSEALQGLGLEWVRTPLPLTASQSLGLHAIEETEQGWLIRDLSPGSDAWAQGLAEGEVIAEIEGRDIRRSSPATWSPGLKPGQGVRILLLRNGAWKEQTLTYTGAYRPEKYEIRPAGAPSAGASARLEAWLRSRQP
jgi:predicted metalloprotease with PDZ domain